MTTLCAFAFALAVIWDTAEKAMRVAERRSLQSRINALKGESK